jgi:hypothetical protein
MGRSQCPSGRWVRFPKQRVERDELREDFEALAGGQYKRLQKEQESLVGVWHNRRLDKEHKQLYAYIHDKYQKILNRCPLHRHLRLKGRTFSNQFLQLVSLHKTRDRLGRAQRIVQHRALDNDCVKLVYSYLRTFYLKKLMLHSVLARHRPSAAAALRSQEFLRNDFSYPVFKQVFNESAGLRRDQGPKWNEDSKLLDTYLYSPSLTASLPLSESTQSLVTFMRTHVDEFSPKRKTISRRG